MRNTTSPGEGSAPSEGLLWIDADGVVAGFHVGKADEIMAMLGDSLDVAIDSAATKRGASPPRRVRVSSPKLAEALRQLQNGIEVVCAPTPEVDPVMGAMQKLIHLETQAKSPQPEALPRAPASDLKFFVMRAAAMLHRADPLAAVHDHRLAISVTIDKLGLRGGLLSVYELPIAVEEEGCWTVTLLATREDFEAMAAYRDESERDIEKIDDPDFDEAAWNDKRWNQPPNLSVTFFPGELPPLDVGPEDEEDGLIPAGANLDFLVLEKGKPGRHPTGDEATLMGVILLSLSEFLKDRRRLKAAWQRGRSFSETFPVDIGEDVVEVVLGAP